MPASSGSLFVYRRKADGLFYKKGSYWGNCRWVSNVHKASHYQTKGSPSVWYNLVPPEVHQKFRVGSWAEHRAAIAAYVAAHYDVVEIKLSVEV